MSETVCIFIPVQGLHVVLLLLVIDITDQERKLRILGGIKQLLGVADGLFDITVWRILVVIKIDQQIAGLDGAFLQCLLCRRHGAFVVLQIVAVNCFTVVLVILPVQTLVTDTGRCDKCE